MVVVVYDLKFPAAFLSNARCKSNEDPTFFLWFKALGPIVDRSASDRDNNQELSQGMTYPVNFTKASKTGVRKRCAWFIFCLSCTYIDSTCSPRPACHPMPAWHPRLIFNTPPWRNTRPCCIPRLFYNPRSYCKPNITLQYNVILQSKVFLYFMINL